MQWITFDFGSRPVLVRKLNVELGVQIVQEKVQQLRKQLDFFRCVLPVTSDITTLPGPQKMNRRIYSPSIPPTQVVFTSKWLVQTARKGDRDRDREEWVTIYYAVLFTLQRERERDLEMVQWVVDPFFCT